MPHASLCPNVIELCKYILWLIFWLYHIVRHIKLVLHILIPRVVGDDIALQETWLIPNDLHLPSQLRKDFDSFVLACHQSERLLAGRPYGGLTFIWRKSH